MINGFCVNVITGPVKFDHEHQSKGGGNEDNRRVKSPNPPKLWDFFSFNYLIILPIEY